jgi:hypothetical protein
VRALEWGGGDALLASCGADGAVYQWKLKNFKRAQEHVLKVCWACSPLFCLAALTCVAAAHTCQDRSVVQHGLSSSAVRQMRSWLLASMLPSCLHPGR